MKNFKILAAALVLALLPITMLSGCGNDPGVQGKTCKDDKGCSKDEKCVNYNDKTKQGLCQKDCTKSGSAVAADATKCDATKELCAPVGNPATSYTCSKKCATSKECGKGMVCAAGACTVLPCDATTNCGAGNECNTDPKVQACQAKAGSTQPPVGCQPADCGGGMNVCNPTTNKCEARKIFSIIIKDMTTDITKKQCTDADAGSDITGVELVNADGTSVSWGTGTSISTGNKEPRVPYANAAPPDGSAPNFHPTNSKECTQNKLSDTSGPIGKYASIGCGGTYALIFNKGINEGRVKVFEYSTSLCSSATGKLGNDEDVYEVYACTPNDLTTEDLVKAALADKTKCVKLKNGTTTTFSGFQELAYPPAS